MSDLVKQVVIETLAIYAGDRLPEQIEDLRAIENLGLDSMDGISVACELSVRLRVLIPDDQNPLVDDINKRGRTVREIIEFVSKCAKLEEEFR